jgi:hypothetical protein
MGPTFLARLLDPSVRTVLIAGCGGGFDFVHGMLLVPELVRAGKKVVVHSYSFGAVEALDPMAQLVFAEGDARVVRVTAAHRADPGYAPEVHVASFLDAHYPARAPHAIYASYARSFTAPALARLYQQLVAENDVDAVVLVDGGSDSLMAGDEEGLGDPIEDAVSVAAVAALERPATRLLLTIGLGADRFNHVSDAASLRAVAELTRAGGALGALLLERDAEAMRFYRGLLEHIDSRQHFRSILSSAILAAAAGGYGADELSGGGGGRVKAGGLFLWPLMAVLWGFEVDAVARRSLLCGWVSQCESVRSCHEAVHRGRAGLGDGVRDVEDLPDHRRFRNPRGRFL